jgi:hypothetical protein
MEDRFELPEADGFAVEVAIRVVRRMLARSTISAKDVTGLGHALYALKRMPLTTPGVWCDFGVKCRFGGEDFNETRYVGFGVYDDAFDISQGGTVYQKSVGGDNFSEPGWRIEMSGYADRRGRLGGGSSPP